MSMPQIPEEKHRPSLQETVIDLLESIALEEIAISHLLNAEAEKTQVLVNKLCEDNTHNIVKELLNCNKATCKIVDTVIIKEWLLLKKMETVLEIDCGFREETRKSERERESQDCNSNSKRIEGW